MKELNQHLNAGNKTELSVKKKQEVEHQLMGKIKPKNGQAIWELNKETGDIKKAEYRTNTASFALNAIPSERLIINVDCIYIPALNAENAKRKYLQNKDQSHYYSKTAPFNLSDICTFK